HRVDTEKEGGHADRPARALVRVELLADAAVVGGDHIAAGSKDLGRAPVKRAPGEVHHPRLYPRVVDAWLARGIKGEEMHLAEAVEGRVSIWGAVEVAAGVASEPLGDLAERVLRAGDDLAR